MVYEIDTDTAFISSVYTLGSAVILLFFIFSLQCFFAKYKDAFSPIFFRVSCKTCLKILKTQTCLLH